MNVLENQKNCIVWPASWSHYISSFSYCDINLFLVDYACCKLCNIWLLLFEKKSRSYHYTGASHWRKNIVGVVTQDKVIDYNLKRQIKIETLYNWRLFLLNQIFQYISNWSKKYLSISPSSFFNMHRVKSFANFSI